ncbi:homoserine kinase [Methanococcus voltae]|uniref:Homoserine kinase n=1 Tax=Methanococcus voltae TaxID=2188 RepID=A0A8J7URG3_METVO|nr:homoserine kinase [Methanococcus voltae]MBP2200607.1 homoserine kinase [Methanococcus voltae]
MKEITIYSPATSANLGPGYDIFGLALKEPYDLVTVEIIESSCKCCEKVKISVSGEKAEEIPLDPTQNTAGVVALKMMEDFNIQECIHIKIQKGIKPGSGLGSSSASCSGVAVAVNKLFELNLDDLKLIKYASLGEAVAAGAPHADNVAPGIRGNFTLTTSYEPLEVLNIPLDMDVVVALPNIQVSTKEARKILPQEIPLSKMVNNVGKATGMIHSIYNKDFENLGKYMMGDQVVEPCRATLIQGYDEAKVKVKDFAYGITISGSGPAIIAIPKNKECSSEIAKIFKEIWDCPIYETSVGKGAYEIKK